jgi:ATP-binding protein involved in chromosome partitioning
MLPGTRTRVIGISSGKGGVGKSSVTVNLAVALAARGLEIGLLDADVYGFSVPKMLGVTRGPVAIDELLVPPVVHGVRCLSMGFFVPDEQPVIWRGPMLHKALEQFLVDAYWGEPDFPPHRHASGHRRCGLVTRPVPAPDRDPGGDHAAAGGPTGGPAFGLRRQTQLGLPVRGVIENMSWFTGDDGARYELFGAGGGEALASELEVPLLGRIPLVPALRQGADDGVPVRISDPDGEAALAFEALADRVEALGPARIYRRELTLR